MTDVTITPMPKRVFIQVEASEEYKAEYQRILGPYMPMSADIRRLLEQEYPTLRALADRERRDKK